MDKHNQATANDHSNLKVWLATSMLVMDVGHEICWLQFRDVGDGFVNTSVGHQHSKDVTNIEILSPTSTCRQHLCSLCDSTIKLKKKVVPRKMFKCGAAVNRIPKKLNQRY